MKTVFTGDMELKFIQLQHNVLLERQRTMTSLQEKIDGVLVEFNAYAQEIGHQELTAKQVKNKTDSLNKKAMAAYKAVRVKSTTGCLVESDFDLEVNCHWCCM